MSGGRDNHDLKSMSSQDNSDDAPHWDDLSAEQRKRIIQLADEHAAATDQQGRRWSLRDLMDMGLSRREAMGALVAIGSGAAFAEAIRQSIGVAKADASDTDSDGDVGEPGDRIDVFADGVDFNTLVIDNTDYEVHKNGTDGSGVLNFKT